MKSIYYFLFILLITSSCQNTDNSVAKKSVATTDSIAKNLDSSKVEKTVSQDVTEKDLEMPPRIFEWKGTINGTIAIHGKYQIANGYQDGAWDIVSGELMYDKVGKPLKLVGQLSEGNYIRLLEMDKKGNVTGVLSGKWENGNLKGTWFSPIKRNELDLVIEATPQDESNYRASVSNKILGQYAYQYGKDGGSGSLNINSIKGDQVKFDVLAVTGAPAHNMATVEEATGTIKDNVITLEMEENCKFQIRVFDGFAVIDYVNNQNECMFGHNAHVSGIYLKQ